MQEERKGFEQLDEEDRTKPLAQIYPSLRQVAPYHSMKRLLMSHGMHCAEKRRSKLDSTFDTALWADLLP